MDKISKDDQLSIIIISQLSEKYNVDTDTMSKLLIDYFEKALEFMYLIRPEVRNEVKEVMQYDNDDDQYNKMQEIIKRNLQKEPYKNDTKFAPINEASCLLLAENILHPKMAMIVVLRDHLMELNTKEILLEAFVRMLAEESLILVAASTQNTVTSLKEDYQKNQ